MLNMPTQFESDNCRFIIIIIIIIMFIKITFQNPTKEEKDKNPTIQQQQQFLKGVK